MTFFLGYNLIKNPSLLVFHAQIFNNIENNLFMRYNFDKKVAMYCLVELPVFKKLGDYNYYAPVNITATSIIF